MDWLCSSAPKCEFVCVWYSAMEWCPVWGEISCPLFLGSLWIHRDLDQWLLEMNDLLRLSFALTELVRVGAMSNMISTLLVSSTERHVIH